MEAIQFKRDKNIDPKQLLALYNDAGWEAYTSAPETLEKAVSNSLFVLTAWENEKLIGLLRVVGDGLTIVYIQDILVLKSHQRKGIGKELLNRTLEQFKSVRQIVLLTDNTPETNAFYENNGFKNVEGLDLRAFMKIEG